MRSKAKRVPDKVHKRIRGFGSMLQIPTTKAFRIQEKFLFGDFVGKRRKKKNGKEVFNIEIEL